MSVCAWTLMVVKFWYVSEINFFSGLDGTPLPTTHNTVGKSARQDCKSTDH